ncbi:putative calcium-transporting ATPase 13 [Forsythia ovata]|uniref:Calcium-transporting ATPase 13 n=1 Tax=Forsythia ovata TaxID=205694 RepID=A0ABD1TNI0_9LAMI
MSLSLSTFLTPILHFVESGGQSGRLKAGAESPDNCISIIPDRESKISKCGVLELKDVNPNGQQKIQDNGLILLGLVGLKDPCRPSVKTTVEDCQYVRVNVKMITGDNVFTATAIATEFGILKLNEKMDDGLVVEGVTFHNYTEEERMEKVDKICVMARSSPLDKLLMVQCLKKKGHVVAVTVDGTNDAPALKEADIGLSMGIQGSGKRKFRYRHFGR